MRQARLETGIQRMLSTLKAALLRVDDIQLANRARHSLVASPDEIDLLRPVSAVSLLSNGFNFPPTQPPVSSASQHLLFFGFLGYKPNADGVRWMCRQVWPLIRASLKTSFAGSLAPVSPNADLNAKIGAAVLAAFPPEIFDSTGLVRSLWQIRLSNAADDARGMLDELSAPPKRSTADSMLHAVDRLLGSRTLRFGA